MDSEPQATPVRGDKPPSRKPIPGRMLRFRGVENPSNGVRVERSMVMLNAAPPSPYKRSWEPVRRCQTHLTGFSANAGLDRPAVGVHIQP